MPTRSEIRDWARTQTLLDIDDISNDKLNAIINEGVREVARRFRWPFLADEDTISLGAGERRVVLNEPAVAHIEAVIVDGRRLRELPATSAWEMYGDNIKGGTPQQFFIWNRSLYFVPFPREAVTLEIKYYTSPTLLENDEDEPEWDARFHMVLADYAVWRLWEREEEDAKAARAEITFGRGVEAMARHYLNRVNDSPVIFGQASRPMRRSVRSFIAGIDG